LAAGPPVGGKVVYSDGLAGALDSCVGEWVGTWTGGGFGNDLCNRQRGGTRLSDCGSRMRSAVEQTPGGHAELSNRHAFHFWEQLMLEAIGEHSRVEVEGCDCELSVGPAGSPVCTERCEIVKLQPWQAFVIVKCMTCREFAARLHWPSKPAIVHYSDNRARLARWVRRRMRRWGRWGMVVG